MNLGLIVLIFEAMAIYLLVLGTHALRRRFGIAPFYALLGAVTAVMSWVTDAGVQVDVLDITFMIGSTVFYTAILLSVFVVYVCDGSRAARIAILTVAGVSALVPLIAAVLHLQIDILGQTFSSYIPVPGLRINSASVVATVLDLVFLAVVWEILGASGIPINTWFRAFLTLLGVMWLDVVLFSTGAFLGREDYLSIMQGTLYSRFVISLFASPFLYFYLKWQNQKPGGASEHRPILAILKEVAEIREELGRAQREIELRTQVEEALHRSEQRYRRLALRTDRLLEQERSSLSDELHDEIGQIMTALKIDLDACEKVVEQTPEVRERASEMHRLLNDGIRRIHSLCRQLRPGAIDDIGLGDALAEMTQEWSKIAGIPCRTDVQGAITLGAEKRIALFRLVQEALDNVAKHAKATQADVILRRGPGGVEFSVEDNGCGMRPDVEKNPFAFGLLNMRERIEALGGTFRIESTLRGGTSIQGSIPV